MAETGRRREKQMQWNAENGITPESVKSRIADILDSVYERDHVRADISAFAESGAMMGNNLKAHLEHLEKRMRDAAADLDFETAARLRDEIKRLRETELAIADDPLAREAERESPASGREKGRHNKGIARHRTAREEGSSLFAKPSLDDMGPGTDMGKPAGTVSRSLFKKQTHAEAHGSDFGIPGEGEKSLFRKNSLDEMTVRRTEKPVEGTLPQKPVQGDNVDAPVRRERAGIGSYEDPAEAHHQGRRSKKTGRPGR